jgi:chemotaxis protein MotB
MKKVRLLAKEQYHEEDSEGTWALSYGDMITLLLSFFVIFFTTNPQQEKVQKLNNLLSFELEGTKPFEPTSLMEKGIVGGKQKVELKNLPKFEGASITAHQVDENIVVTFKATSFFSSGEVKPNDRGRKLLVEFAEKYMPYAGNYRLAIKGFTDSKPVSQKRLRKYEDNLELSALRSIASMKVLQLAGIPLNRMEIAGGGELESIEKVLPNKEGLTKDELASISRTIVLVISPVKESWL